MRALLFVVAAEIIVLSVPALVLGGSSDEAHDARHLSAFSIAYAVALLVVAMRPARARAMLPVAAVLAVLFVGVLLRWRPQLLPYMVVVHGLMDLALVLMVPTAV